MKISFRENNSDFILNLHSESLSRELILKLKKNINKIPKNKRVALDLKRVESFSSDFIFFLKEFSVVRKLSLINVNPDLFVLLNLTQSDKLAYLYLDRADFYENKRALLNRKFSILSNY